MAKKHFAWIEFVPGTLLIILMAVIISKTWKPLILLFTLTIIIGVALALIVFLYIFLLKIFNEKSRQETTEWQMIVAGYLSAMVLCLMFVIVAMIFKDIRLKKEVLGIFDFLGRSLFVSALILILCKTLSESPTKKKQPTTVSPPQIPTHLQE